MIVTLPIPKNEADFEELALEYARDQLEPAAAQPYGARGAGQSGIDHQLRLPSGDWIGIQCKRYWSKRLTTALLQKDLDAAHALAPPLKRYVVATTKRAATALQDWARAATIHGDAAVDIWFWDDIERWLNADPARLNRYDARPALVHASSLALQVGATRSPQDIIAFAASSSADAEPEAVKVAIAFLQAGNLGQAITKLDAERKALVAAVSVWRVSAAAAYMSGEQSAALDFIRQARALGIADIRLDAIEAAAWRAQGDDERARSALAALLARADSTTRGTVLVHWLNLRSEVDHASYDDLAAEVTSADRADPQVHLPLAQAALFAGNAEAFEAHVATLAAADEKIGGWVLTLLRSMARILEGERLAVRQGIPLRDGELNDRIAEAVAELDGLGSRLFADAPRALNRPHLLTWIARGAILLGHLDRADASFMAALNVAPPGDGLLQHAAHYAAQWNRRAFWNELLERPDASHDPLIAIMREARNAEDGVPGAREAMRGLQEGIPEGDGRRAPAIAARLYLPFDQTDSLEAIDRALAELPRTSDPDALVIGLAMQLRQRALPPATINAIRAGLSGKHSRSWHVETHLAAAAILTDAGELELRNNFVPARDAAVDAAADTLPRSLALQAVQLALSERRLNHAAELIQRFIPESGVDRVPSRLRAELAIQNGDFPAARDHLGRLVENKLASARDVAQWVWCATVTGQALAARHALRQEKFPPLDSPKDINTFAQALTLLHRKRDYVRLLASAGDTIDDEEDLFPAVVAGMMTSRELPAPNVAAVDTIAVLRRTDGSEQQRMVWITNKPGVSAQSFTRVTPQEAWLAPLLGQAVGTVVAFTSGAFAGTWKLEQLLAGAIGTQSRVMEWATRQGIEGGGVDSLDGGDDPVGAITKQLQDNKAKSTPAHPDAPIAMIAHVRDTIPFRVFGHAEQLRCFFGRQGEVDIELRMLRDAGGEVLVDPLTILVAEQLQIAETLLKAAGHVRVVAQARTPLVRWWQEERDHRHAPMSASIDSAGQTVFQEHTPALREWGRRFWRAIGRWQSDPRVTVVDDIDDASMLSLSVVGEALDPGTIATIAAAISTDRPFVSIDGNLVGLTRRYDELRTKAVSVIALLQFGALRGSISWLECAQAKARLARSRWSFVTVNAKELSAVMRTSDRHRRHADLDALLSAFPMAEPSGAVRVVVSALDALADQPAKRRPMALAEQLFRALPPMARSRRAELAPAPRGRWYSQALRAWRKNGA